MRQIHEFRRTIAELQSRERETLSLYEPLPQQRAFHQSQARERIFVAANQVGKSEPLTEPVLTPTGWVNIGDICVGDNVFSGDGTICSVTGVFPQGVRPVFRVEFDDGLYTRCCNEHLWKCRLTHFERFGWKKKPGRKQPDWKVRSLAEIRAHGGDNPKVTRRAVIPVTGVVQFHHKQVPIDAYLLGALLGDGSITGEKMSFATGDQFMVEELNRLLPFGHELVHSDRCNYRIRSGGVARRHASGWWAGASCDDLKASLINLGVYGKYSYEKFVPKSYLYNSPEVRAAVLQGLMDTDGDVMEKGIIGYCSTSKQLADDVAFLCRSFGGKVKRWERITKYTHKGEKRTGRRSYNLRIRMPDPTILFRLPRKLARVPKSKSTTHDLVLQKIVPDGESECVCISVDHPSQTYLTRDFIVTHNTTGAIIEVAMALTGVHPRLPAKNGRCFLVAKDGKEIGEVLYRKLCRPGLFKIIYDKELERWRPYKWWIDGENNPNVQDSPPLLPRRFIRSIAWDKKAAHIPEVINCINGWEARFFTSLGAPPHGVQLDMALLDEEVICPDWYPEVMARLIAKNGLFMWSATPQKATHRLLQLYERAKEEAEKPEGERGIEAFFMELADNPYLTDKQKQEFIASIGGDEQEYLVRVKGQFAILGYRVFPEFERREEAMTNFELSTIPGHWTRYAITDPGRQVCAVMFAAVPPPDEGDFIYLYDELYMRNCTADHYGANMKAKSEGQQFYDFIIDYQGARVRDAGQGRSIESQYSEALARYRVTCKLNGVGFSHGVPDKVAGVEAIRELIRVREDGTTKLRYFKQRMPNFDWEMKHWHYKRNPDGTLKDDPEDRGRVHLAACARYLALYRPKYQRPEMGGQYLGVSYERYLDKMKRRRQLMGTPRLNLGPGGRTVSL